MSVHDWPAVSPQQCALMVALPRSLAEFQADCHRPDMDFSRAVWKAFNGKNTEQLWEESLGRLIHAVSAVEREAAGCGVRVLSSGHSSDLGQSFLRNGNFGMRTGYLCLIAHRRFVPLVMDDILNPTLFVERLHNILCDDTPSRVAMVLRRGFGNLKNVGKVVYLEEIVAQLQELLQPVQRYYEDYATWWLTHLGTVVEPDDDPAGLLTRTDLDVLFGESLRPSAEVEFRDGLKTVRQLAESIPENFEGFIQLDVCHGVIVAEALKRMRPKAHFIVGNRRVHPVRALARFVTIIRCLRQKPQPILEVLETVRGGHGRKTLMDQLDQILSDYLTAARPDVYLGGKPDPQDAKQREAARQFLCERLGKAQHRNDRYYFACALGISLVIVAEVVAVVVLRHDAKLIAAASGVFGVSVGWLVTKLIALVREGQILRILIATAPVNDAALEKLIEVVRKMIAKRA